MQTIHVPTFDYDLAFKGNVTVKIKNKPNDRDYQKVTRLLPGFTQGYCSRFFRLGQDVDWIPILAFYDSRQGRGLRYLKGHNITLSK